MEIMTNKKFYSIIELRTITVKNTNMMKIQHYVLNKEIQFVQYKYYIFLLLDIKNNNDSSKIEKEDSSDSVAKDLGNILIELYGNENVLTLKDRDDKNSNRYFVQTIDSPNISEIIDGKSFLFHLKDYFTFSDIKKEKEITHDGLFLPLNKEYDKQILNFLSEKI